MSFILDALTRAEHGRDTVTAEPVPALPVFEKAPSAPGRPAHKRMVLASALLLAAVIAAWGFLVKPAPPLPPVARTPVTADRGPQPARAVAPASVVAAPPDVRPLDREARRAVPAAVAAPRKEQAPPTAPSRGTVVYEDGPLEAPVRAAPAAAPAITPGTVRTLPPAGAPAPAAGGEPSYAQLRLGGRLGGLDSLHLDIHVHGANPSDRFVFVNMRKYREGEELTEGAHLLEITADGALLSYRGQRFVLTRN